MFSSTTLSTLLLASTSLPLSVIAADCYAIGLTSMNEFGWGLGGTTTTAGSSIILYNENDEQIGAYDQCEMCQNPCADLIHVPTDNLAYVFSWGASCADGVFKECHGAYNTQSHIDGEPPENGSDFYGVGVSVDSECRVNFSCP